MLWTVRAVEPKLLSLAFPWDCHGASCFSNSVTSDCPIFHQQCTNTWGKEEKNQKCRRISQETLLTQRPDTLLPIALSQDGVFLSYAKQLRGEHHAPAKILHVTGCHQQGQRHQKCARWHQNSTSEALARTRQDSPLDQRSSACAERVAMGWNSEETGSVCWYLLLSLHFTKYAVAPFKARAE